MKIGEYELENDVEFKVIPDGYEIFNEAVENHNIKPDDFESADWGMYGSIIVYHEPSPGAQLAAMRKFETKTCECGDAFTALAKTTHCHKCRAKLRKRVYRAKQKEQS